MVGQYMTDPLEVKVNQSATVNQNIDHQFALVRILTNPRPSPASWTWILTCTGWCLRTRRDTQALAEDLLKRGYRADALHGEMSQAQRDRVMLRSSKSTSKCWWPPTSPPGASTWTTSPTSFTTPAREAAYYTHRSGRTARAGKKGISLALMGVKERDTSTGCRGRWTSSSPSHGAEP